MKYILPILMTLLFTACGGGGGSAATDPDSSTIRGVAIDGYIVGATVCVDSNLNNICDPGEHNVTTDSNGAYSFSSSYTTSNSVVIAYGGTDNNGNFDYIVKNVVSNKSSDFKLVLSGITTLVVDYMDVAGVDVATAESAISTYLDIGVGSLDEDIENGNYTTAFQKNLKIFNIVKTINTVKAGDVQNYTESAITFKSIASAIENNSSIRIADGTIDLLNGRTGIVNIGNSPPVFLNTNDFVVYEDDDIFLVTLNAIDPDNNNITYTLESVHNYSSFNKTVDENITFNSSVPNFNKTNYSDNNFLITVRATDDYNGDNKYVEQNITVRVTTTGWNLYNARGGNTAVTLDGTPYNWDGGNLWYKTGDGATDKILMPVKRLSNVGYKGNNLDIIADGHYSVNNNKYLFEDRENDEAIHSSTTSYNAVSGTTIASNHNFQHDSEHKLFVSRVSHDGSQYIVKKYLEWISDNNNSYIDAPSSNTSYSTNISNSAYQSVAVKVDPNNNGNDFCANYYGTGWRLPTSYEIGISFTDINDHREYNGYIPAYVGNEDTSIISSTYYTENGDEWNWNINTVDGKSRLFSLTENIATRCIYKSN